MGRLQTPTLRRPNVTSIIEFQSPHLHYLITWLLSILFAVFGHVNITFNPYRYVCHRLNI